MASRRFRAPDADACLGLVGNSGRRSRCQAVPRYGRGQLNLAPEAEILTLLTLLDRLCAMLTRLAHMGGRPSEPTRAGHPER